MVRIFRKEEKKEMVKEPEIKKEIIKEPEIEQDKKIITVPRVVSKEDMLNLIYDQLVENNNLIQQVINELKEIIK